MRNGKHYTYELAYPDCMGGAVFYVGKGTYSTETVFSRIDAHESETRHGHNCKRHQVIREIWATGEQIVKRVVFETDVEQDALIYEWVLVNLIYGRENLANMNAAGGIKDPQYSSTYSRTYQNYYHRKLRNFKKNQEIPIKNA